MAKTGAGAADHTGESWIPARGAAGILTHESSTKEASVIVSSLISILDRLIQLKEYRDRRLQELFTALLEPTFNDLLQVHRDYLEVYEKIRQGLPKIDGLSATLLQTKRGTIIRFKDPAEAEMYANAYGAQRTWVAPAPTLAYVVPIDLADGTTLRGGAEDRRHAEELAKELGVSPDRITGAEQIYPSPQVMERLRNLRNDVAASRLAFEPVREKIKIVAHRATELESRPTAKSFVLAVAQYFPTAPFDREESSFRRSGMTTLIGELDGMLSSSHTAYDLYWAMDGVDDMLKRFEEEHRINWSIVCETFADVRMSVINRR